MSPLTNRLPERALVVGLGGLGCPASLALAEGGVRHLTLIDPDRVELSNLPRQPWHRLESLGVPKVESAERGLRQAFPDLSIDARMERLDEVNGEALFSEHAVVIDGTDQGATKFFLSDLAVRTGVKLIHGGVVGLRGQVMSIEPGGPCLRCLFEPSAVEQAPGCAQAGVLGSLAGVIGSYQGLAALLPRRAGPIATLWTVEGAAFLSRLREVRRTEDCPVCGIAPSGPPSVLPPPSLTETGPLHPFPEPAAQVLLDVSDEICPMTYVRTRLALEAMQPGEVLALTLLGEEAARNVPRSVVDEGHALVSRIIEDGGKTRLLIRKKRS